MALDALCSIAFLASFVAVSQAGVFVAPMLTVLFPLFGGLTTGWSCHDVCLLCGINYTSWEPPNFCIIKNFLRLYVATRTVEIEPGALITLMVLQVEHRLATVPSRAGRMPSILTKLCIPASTLSVPPWLSWSAVDDSAPCTAQTVVPVKCG